MKKALISILIVPLLLAFISQRIEAQSLLPQVQNTQQTSDSIEKRVEAIPLNEINVASTTAFASFSRVATDRLTPEERAKLLSDVDSLSSQVLEFLNDTIGLKVEVMNYRELEILNNGLSLLRKELSDQQTTINKRLGVLQGSLNSLKKARSRWQLTRELDSEVTTPEALLRRINTVISKNDSVAGLLQGDIDFLLTQSDRITSQQIKLDQVSLDLEEQGKMSSSRVLRLDAQPIWTGIQTRDSLSVGERWRHLTSSIREDTTLVRSSYSGRIVLILILFGILLFIIFWMRSSVEASEIVGKRLMLSLYVNEIFHKPFEVALLLGLYLVRIIIPELPTSYGSLLAIISVYAILRIAFDILPRDYQRFFSGFAVAYVLLRLFNLFYDPGIFGRVFLLATQIIALVFILQFVFRAQKSRKRRKSFINYALTSAAWVFLISLFIALIANVLGGISLAEYLSDAIIKSIFMILTTYVGFHVLSALIYLIMSSNIGQRSNIIRSQFNNLFTKVFKLLKFLFVFSWITITLEHFNVKTSVIEWGAEFFTKEINIGEAVFSLINIILFIFVIWLSVFISRIVRNILQAEVFPRIKVERGVPGTIIMMVRIVLVSIGFLLAAAAAGMELSSLTIILGAFSVGIGFGLQNIFNNLVSGLILAFERPIKEGDIVEVNSLLGTVKKIGIRSSVVRTFAGAEVIVPNGTLISNELINWTLSDEYRRADIRVGVAYGTDPKKVTALLLKVAEDNDRVIMKPKPEAYFINFGDSSLDFRLNAWIDNEHRFEVESELRIAISMALKEAGMEIPFPQTDLHVRSVDKDIIKGMTKE